MRKMWSVATRWQHVGQDAVALPALGIFTCWMVSCKECTLFENKRCTLFEKTSDALFLKTMSLFGYFLEYLHIYGYNSDCLSVELCSSGPGVWVCWSSARGNCKLLDRAGSSHHRETEMMATGVRNATSYSAFYLIINKYKK